MEERWPILVLYSVSEGNAIVVHQPLFLKRIAVLLDLARFVAILCGSSSPAQLCVFGPEVVIIMVTISNDSNNLILDPPPTLL